MHLAFLAFQPHPLETELQLGDREREVKVQILVSPEVVHDILLRYIHVLQVSLLSLSTHASVFQLRAVGGPSLHRSSICWLGCSFA